MDISKNIRTIREQKGVKQSEMALMLNIDPPNYNRLEKRGDKLSMEQLVKIANALEVDVLDIVNHNSTELTTQKFETIPIPVKKMVIVENKIIELEAENTTSRSRVTELEERIKELKSVIDSKDTIVHTLNVATNDLLSNLFIYLDKLLIYKALKLKMIDYDSTKNNIQYYYDENGNVDYWNFKSSKTEPHLNALDLLSVENLTELFVFQDVGKYCTDIILILSEWAESPFVELDIFLTWNDLFQKLPLNERYEFILGWESQREFVKKGLVSKRK